MNNNELNIQTENLEIQSTDDLETQSTDADSTVTDDLEDMIEQLPENFPQALTIIQNEIAPIIAECDPGLKDITYRLSRKGPRRHLYVSIKYVIFKERYMSQAFLISDFAVSFSPRC